MTYNVFGGTLKLAQLQLQLLVSVISVYASAIVIVVAEAFGFQAVHACICDHLLKTASYKPIVGISPHLQLCRFRMCVPTIWNKLPQDL